MDDTVNREIGVTAAQLYLRNKGNALWLKRQHSSESHKKAMWFSFGFFAAMLLGFVVMLVDSLDKV